MKKIAIITHEYYPRLSGGTIFSEKIAFEFAKRGHHVEVLCPSIGAHDGRRVKSDGFYVKRFYTARYTQDTATLFELGLFIVLGFPQLLYYLGKNRFTHTFAVFVVPSGFMMTIIQKLTGIPAFVFVDGGDTPGVISEQKNLMDRLKFLFCFVTKKARGVVLVNGVEDIALPLIDNKNVAVVPHGTSISPEVLSIDTQRVVTKFLSIGRLVPRKGFHYIIEAANILRQKHRDFLVDIIGYGEQEGELKRLIQKYDLQSHVNLLGRIEYQALKACYLDHDIYIFYGEREGASLAMIEALSYGTPLIASDDLSSKPFVQNYENGILVDWRSPEKLSQAMQWMLEHKSQLPDFGRKSREIALNFSWASIAKQYDEFFDKSAK